MINKIGSFSQLNTTQIQEKKTINIEEEKQISRVEAIKEQIKNENYQIDIEKTAKAFAKALL